MDGGIFQEEPNIFFAILLSTCTSEQITNEYLFAFMYVCLTILCQSIDMQEAQFNSL